MASGKITIICLKTAAPLATKAGPPAVSVYVVGQVLPTDLTFGPGEASASYLQVSCPHLLIPKMDSTRRPVFQGR